LRRGLVYETKRLWRTAGASIAQQGDPMKKKGKKDEKSPKKGK